MGSSTGMLVVATAMLLLEVFETSNSVSAAGAGTGEAEHPNPLHDVHCLEAGMAGRPSQLIPQDDRGTSADFKAMYPLTDTIVKDAITWGDSTKMARVLAKIKKTGPEAKPLVIAAIGGSFTHGTGCDDEEGNTLFKCAWASRLGRWFEKAFPGTPVEVIDWTWPGTTSAVFLGGISVLVQGLSRSPDIVVLDTLVNDAGESWGIQSEMQFGSHFEKLGVPYEALVRALQELLPDAQLLTVLAGCPMCLTSSAAFNSVAQHYGMPVINYAHIVGRYNKLDDPTGPDRLWPLLIGGDHNQQYDYQAEIGRPWKEFAPTMIKKQSFYYPENHVPYAVHAYHADIIATVVLGMFEAQSRSFDNRDATCHSAPWEQQARHHHARARAGTGNQTSNLTPLFDQEKIDRFHTCTNPATLYAATDAINGGVLSKLPTVQSGDWRLYEDRKNKPGWIGTQARSKLVFEVEFGWFPTLAISYLKSYEGMQAAAIEIEPIGDEPPELARPEGRDAVEKRKEAHGKDTLDPATEDKHAQTRVQFFGRTDWLLQKIWDYQEAMLHAANAIARKDGKESVATTQQDRRFKYRITISLPEFVPANSKFKLISVISC